MLLKRTIIAALCGGALASFPALSQEAPAYKSEISIGASLPFIKSTTAYGVQQSASLNGGLLAGYRFNTSFHPEIAVSTSPLRSYAISSWYTAPKLLGSRSNKAV